MPPLASLRLQLSEAEITLLRDKDAEAVIGVEVGISTPLRYCTGGRPVEIDSDWYYPRGMKIGEIMISSPQSSNTSIELNNADSALSVANRAERFSGELITYHLLLRKGKKAWTEIGAGIPWACSHCTWNPMRFKIEMGLSIGHRRRACLGIGNVRCDLILADSRCKYEGVDTFCDGTWEDCDSKSNTLNFRGMRFAPEPNFVVKGVEGWMQFPSSPRTADMPGGWTGSYSEDDWRNPGGQNNTRHKPGGALLRRINDVAAASNAEQGTASS